MSTVIGMQGNIFQRSMAGHCQAALAKARTLDIEGHNGLKGQLREIIVGDLLTPVLPPEVRIGTGKLVSSLGGESPQIDIILYAPAILPPFLFDQKSGYFPIESALYVIEVKSKLNSSTLRDAIKNAQATRALPLLATNHWSVGSPAGYSVNNRPADTPKAVNTLFALGSDLTGSPQAELERYLSLDPNSADKPAIQVICIAGRGYWYLKDGWRYIPADENIGEIMGFLAGTTNTIPQLMVAKGRPNFGMYLTTESCQPRDP